MRDDAVANAFIGRLGQDAAGDQLILGGVRPIVDDAFHINVAHAGQRSQFSRGSGVDIQQTGNRGRGSDPLQQRKSCEIGTEWWTSRQR